MNANIILKPEEQRELLRVLDETKATLEHIRGELIMCRDELCLRCGDYKQRHLGACDGCRWKNV